MKISPEHSITITLPHSIPVGTMARVSITIPTVLEDQSGRGTDTSAKPFRGILKGRGISLERLREMQREDKALENAADERWNRARG